MKGNKLLSCLLYGAMAFCIAVSGAGCIVTAFRFAEPGAVISFTGLERADMQTVALWSAGFSLLSVFAFSQKRKWAAWLAAAAVLGLLAVTGMLEELYALAYRISIFYDKAYRWGTLPVYRNVGESSEVTDGLVAVCAFVIFAVSWVLCCQKPTTVAVAVGFLPLAACCVVTDTVPDETYLFLLLFGLVLVMLTGTARRSSQKAGAQLTALLMVPVLLASMFLSYKMPRESYAQQSEMVRQTMLSWVTKLPFVVQLSDGKLEISVSGTTSENVNLATVGPMTKNDYAVMDVVSSVSQRLYLRGQSFDTYNRKSWTNSESSTGRDSSWPENATQIGKVTIRTRSRMKYLFVPYYTAGAKDLIRGGQENTAWMREYSYSVMRLKGDERGPESAMSAVCLALPGPTKEEAETIWARIWAQKGSGATKSQSRDTYAKLVGEYVRSCAAYSLNTPRMPEDEADFALWFLQYGKTGYCTHFATAATVLLRAAGVPARYVTGYAVEVTAGQKVTVTADKSHAWVEYLNDNNIWTVLEATPAAGMEEAATQPQIQPTRPPIVVPKPTMPDQTDPLSTEASESSPSQQTGPSGEPQGQGADRSGLWAALRWLTGILGALAAVAGQYFLRRHLRRKKMKKGSPNRQALNRWIFIKRMAKLIGQKPPGELYLLAEKAKFSQHTMTDAELAQMDVYLAQAQLALSEKPRLQQLVLRLIWAV